MFLISLYNIRRDDFTGFPERKNMFQSEILYFSRM